MVLSYAPKMLFSGHLIFYLDNPYIAINVVLNSYQNTQAFT